MEGSAIQRKAFAHRQYNNVITTYWANSRKGTNGFQTPPISVLIKTLLFLTRTTLKAIDLHQQ